MTGKGLSGVTVDEEADLLNLRERRMDSAEKGVESELLDQDAGGVMVYKGSVEVDDGYLGSGAGGKKGFQGGSRECWRRDRSLSWCRGW